MGVKVGEGMKCPEHCVKIVGDWKRPCGTWTIMTGRPLSTSTRAVFVGGGGMGGKEGGRVEPFQEKADPPVEI
jgi:hypothetical protein